jgi:hypothetical protein
MGRFMHRLTGYVPTVNTRSKGAAMTERWTREGVTPGEDPREIDAEYASEEALDQVAAQEAVVNPQEPRYEMGTTSDAPGLDIDEARRPGQDVAGPPRVQPDQAESLDPPEPEPPADWGLPRSSAEDDGT